MSDDLTTKNLKTCSKCGMQIHVKSNACVYCGAEQTEALPSLHGIYREGDILVMARDAELPDICMLSNQPTGDYRLKRTFTRHPVWVSITIFLCWPLGFIFALFTRKRATINIPLAPEMVSKRNREIILAWITFFIGLAFCLSSFFDSGLLILGIIITLLAFLLGGFASRLLTAQEFDEEYIWLKGVHPDYLDRFPSYGE